MTQETIYKLIDMAANMRKYAYAPYSHFTVGAALLSANGKIYTGCNIENSAFSPSICAERTAFAKAVSEGYRDFEAICIIGGNADTDADDLCMPCGVCRQVFLEFCHDDFKIILAVDRKKYKIYTLNDLVPMGFRR